MATMVMTGIVGALHVWIMILEMFLWTKAPGRKLHGQPPEMAEKTRALAANQGLYNGFLAAGLFWSLATADPGLAHALQIFFLGCVFVAGIFGAATANRKILFVQALPAAVALAVVFFS